MSAFEKKHPLPTWNPDGDGLMGGRRTVSKIPLVPAQGLPDTATKMPEEPIPPGIIPATGPSGAPVPTILISVDFNGTLIDYNFSATPA
jgi:hypothetical protein